MPAQQRRVRPRAGEGRLHARGRARYLKINGEWGITISRAATTTRAAEVHGGTDARRGRSGGHRAGARRGLGAVLLALGWLLLAAGPAAAALKAIDLTNDGERLDISSLGEFHEPQGDQITVDTAPGRDGVTVRLTAKAAPGTNPAWFSFALRNTTDKQVERWLAVDRYNTAGSGVVWPDLDARRIEKVSHSLGYTPERLRSDRADVFRLTLEPGQTVTFIAELTSDRFARMYLWSSLDYEQRDRDRQLFYGIMLGITGLLAIFLTAVFAANHKAIFPSAAVFTWCVLAYLCVDFGFWQKLFSIRPEENARPGGNRSRHGGKPAGVPAHFPAQRPARFLRTPLRL